MKLTFLGTGTSTGVPMLGCFCPVCTSDDTKNRRMRSSILIESETSSVVVDTGPEFRLQALSVRLKRLDAVLYTHAHADHILGIDDLRPLTFDKSLAVYCEDQTRTRLEQSFSYIFSTEETLTSKPKLDFRPLEAYKRLSIAGIDVLPLKIEHGPQEILGFRFGPVAYLTDCSSIPPRTLGELENLDTLILGALRYEKHPTHFNLEQALEAARKVGARKTWLTHLSHRFDHRTLAQELAHSNGFPATVEPAYDGLVLSWENGSKS